MPTQKMLLLFSFLLATCLGASTSFAKDFAQSKPTDNDIPAKSTPEKKKNKAQSISKKHPEAKKKSHKKKTVPTGYCVSHNKLISLAEVNCKRKKGSFFQIKNRLKSSLLQTRMDCVSKGKTLLLQREWIVLEKGCNFSQTANKQKVH